MIFYRLSRGKLDIPVYLDYNRGRINAATTFARMAEQADALDLGSSPEQGWGFNSPSSHT